MSIKEVPVHDRTGEVRECKGEQTNLRIVGEFQGFKKLLTFHFSGFFPETFRHNFSRVTGGWWALALKALNH